jgi:hypothetical protein
MIRVTAALFFGLALQLPAQTAEQTTAEEAAQLAARTSSLVPRRTTVSVETRNLTALPAAEWSNFRSLLLNELHKAGVETSGTPSESRLRVTLSQDARGLLLVAEVFTGDSRQIALLPWNLPSLAQAKPRFRITRKILWSQPEPILDVLLTDSDSAMLVLSANGVATYRSSDDKWVPVATASLVLPRPMPRDPRGRLVKTLDGFRAYLPAATCDGIPSPQLSLTCAATVQSSPDLSVRWVAGRNVFESDAVKSPVYSSGGGLFAMADGHVEDRSGQPVTGTEGWGSDIARIADPCGSGTAVVASSANTEREEIRAFEVAGAQATSASEPMSLPGPVTALWSTESGVLATLVVNNLQTGEYEASRLGLACTQ